LTASKNQAATTAAGDRPRFSRTTGRHDRGIGDYYLYRLLTEKDPAKEIRAFGLGDYLTARHTTLYDRHMTQLRKTTRKRFRIAVVSTLGLAAALGAGMAGLLALAMSGRLELAETATAAGALLILGERIMTTVGSVGDMCTRGRAHHVRRGGERLRGAAFGCERVPGKGHRAG